MLRINQNSHAGGAKSYYTSSDYYVDGQELPGVWRGKAAYKLGLTGEILRIDWDAVCDGMNPKTGEKLLKRRKDNRTAGYDFNVHAPTSVSVPYADTKDPRLLDAFRESVDATMGDIESEMQTRVRKSGANEDRVTGNMVWGEFVHFTSRPVDGIPDPHLHAHCFVFNTTWDDQEQSWKAGQFRELKRDAPYFEALFHSRFSRRLADLGLPVERTRNGWEIAGVPRSLVEKFSRRTALIEEAARDKGIEDPADKAELGAKTRSRKAKDLTLPELQREWRSRMTPDEAETLRRLAKSLGNGAARKDDKAAELAVNYAIGHEFERRSVMPERQLLATALKRAVGFATPEQVARQMARTELITSERSGRRLVTTPAVLDEERRILAFARDGRGSLKPLAKTGHVFKRDWLNVSQRAAVRHILESHDRVILVRGAAGVGKTSLMQEAVQAMEAGGTKVVALAPTADASRGVLRADGFRHADTVARLLGDKQMQQHAKDAVWWIDEAGLLGAKDMAQLFDLADKLDARVILTGDKRQHGSVARGAMLKLLEEEAGIRPAEVKEIQRQKDHYQEAVKALSDGRAADGFSRLDSLGWVREIPDEAERNRTLAADYVAALSQGKSALVISPTHVEGERIESEIRRQRKAQNQLGRERSFRVLQNRNLTEAERGDAINYLPGDVIQFHQNAKGFARGERVEVRSQKLPLEYAYRFTAFRARTLALSEGDVVRITHNGFTLDKRHRLNNGALYRIKGFDGQGNIQLDNGWKVAKDFGHLAYGYVVTSHAAQGKTVDRVFIGQCSRSLPAASSEQFYVSCSRARESATIYCDDKQTLREAVAQSDDRMSATELFRDDRSREAVEVQRRYRDLGRKPAEIARGGVEHER